MSHVSNSSGSTGPAVVCSGFAEFRAHESHAKIILRTSVKNSSTHKFVPKNKVAVACLHRSALKGF